MERTVLNAAREACRRTGWERQGERLTVACPRQSACFRARSTAITSRSSSSSSSRTASSSTSGTSTSTSTNADADASSSSLHTSAPIPLSSPHKFFLGLGSAAASLLDPSRGDQIALLSELSSEPFHLARMRDQMLASEEGRRILLDRPQINTKTVDMAYLRSLPEGTFGNEYTRWLDWCGVGPDTRAEVLHVDDPTLRYIMARNRQSHDMHHLLCLMPVSHLGETVVKMFEASHFGLPVSYLSALAGPLRLSAEERAKLLGFGLAYGSGLESESGSAQGHATASGPARGLAAWAWRQGQITSPLINVYWEKRWEQDFGELRRELGFDEDPPFRVAYDAKRKRRDDLSRGRWPSKIIQAQKDAA